MEQLEPDFRDIERQHDAPPDEIDAALAAADMGWGDTNEEDEDA